jgi:hypothetical protein
LRRHAFHGHGQGLLFDCRQLIDIIEISADGKKKGMTRRNAIEGLSLDAKVYLPARAGGCSNSQRKLVVAAVAGENRKL